MNSRKERKGTSAFQRFAFSAFSLGALRVLCTKSKLQKRLAQRSQRISYLSQKTYSRVLARRPFLIEILEVRFLCAKTGFLISA
jgi:hypothetical protein